MEKTFGAFIHEKRKKNDYSLRKFSILIGLSPEYLSKIENNLRSAPKDEVILKISDELRLSYEEKELLFDLAAESKPYPSLASDLVKYLRENEAIHKTLRLAKRYSLTNKEWREIYEYISKTYS